LLAIGVIASCSARTLKFRSRLTRAPQSEEYRLFLLAEVSGASGPTEGGMQLKMLFVFLVAALFMSCGAAPDGAASPLTKAIATVNSGSFRIDRQANGTGWIINSPIPEPLGVAQGATVASADGSRIYHIGGITGAMTPTKKVRIYSPADDSWSEAADLPVTTGILMIGAAVEVNCSLSLHGAVQITLMARASRAAALSRRRKWLDGGAEGRRPDGR